MGLGCLFALQGIPCVYYGTEQGLHGAGGSPEAVREALWGKPNAFDRSHPFFQATRRLAAVRADQPALRYGRQYFRPISGDGVHFGLSTFRNGVLAFSRILNDQEVLVVANTDAGQPWRGDVIVDYALNPAKTPYKLLYSNKAGRSASSRPQVVGESRRPTSRSTRRTDRSRVGQSECCRSCWKPARFRSCGRSDEVAGSVQGAHCA